MKTYIDCIPCFVENGVHLAKRVAKNQKTAAAIVSAVLKELLSHDHANPPPFMARKISAILREMGGVADPYLEEKDQSTRFAKDLMVSIMPELERRDDRFDAIVRLAIAGNIIDFGIDTKFQLESARAKIIEAFNVPIDSESIRSLKEHMDAAKSILYITDNCGEAVFDRLLIEPYKEKITLAVRGKPVLNDLTRREVVESELGGLPLRIVDTGDSTPGICPEHSSKEFLDAFDHADLIISKGQGNYETLSDTKRPIFFLFRAKCAVVCAHLGGAPNGSFQVLGKNLE